MSTLYDTKTREPSLLPIDQIPQAIASGTHSYQSDAKINVLKDGVSYNVSGKDIPAALQEGYTLESPKQQAVREYLKENQGLKGAAKVALGQFADEALMGIPELIYDKTQDPFEVAKKEALKQQHETANTLGGIGGFGASFLAGGPLFKGAELAGKTVERGIVGGAEAEAKAVASTDYLASLFKESGVKKGAWQMASDLTRRTAGAAARMGVEGAVINAPKAITEASLGDPDTAGETLLYGVGGGMLLGGLATAAGPIAKLVPRLLEKGGNAAGEIGSKITSELADSAAVKENLGEELGANYDVTSPTADKIKESIGRKAGGALAGSIGLSHGPIGGFVGYKLGEGAGELAANVIPDSVIKNGLLFAEQSMKYSAEKLEAINDVLASLGKKGFTAASVGGNAFGKFVNEDVSENDQLKSFDKLQHNLTAASADPALLANNGGILPDRLQASAPQIATAYSMKQANALSYLQNNLPKNKRAPDLFHIDPWAPSGKQLKDFHDKVEIVNNPFAALDHLQQGTLTSSHMDALTNVYPNLLGEMQKRIVKQAAKKQVNLSMPVRQKLNMFLQTPPDMKMYPAYQANFSADNKPANKTNPVNLPDSQTQINKVAAS